MLRAKSASQAKKAAAASKSDPIIDESDDDVSDDDAEVDEAAARKAAAAKKLRKAKRRKKRDPTGLLDLPSDHQEAVSSSDSEQEDEERPSSGMSDFTKYAAKGLPLLMFGGMGLGSLTGPIADKVTAVFTTLTLVQKAGAAAVAVGGFIYATGMLLRTALGMLVLAGYLGWCAQLPVAVPYTVQDFETLEVSVSSGSRRSELLQGSYDRQADTWHNGARVYTREGGPPGSEYEHEHSNGGGSSAAAMHLHFHVTKGGSCYWRIGSNLTAPNKDQSIRALTGPNCRVLGLSDLAATNKRGSVRWDIHTGGHTSNDGSLTGKLKWTKDRRFSVEPIGNLGTYYLNPPNEVMVAHLCVAVVFWVYYRWQTSRAAKEMKEARKARADERKAKRKRKKAERKAAKKAKEAVEAAVQAAQAELDSPEAIAQAEIEVAAAKAGLRLGE